ncbi:hypothetical protein [Enterococcus sp. DIV0187]|uniref:hypothetical protein n=1 Tax=Enterococcus sp. DIV0187 TaxID=2774644 RepID=UPI003F2165F3
MYFKNSVGKVYIEGDTVCVETETCKMTVTPNDDMPKDFFISEEYKSQVESLKFAEMIIQAE